jgi:hypothetical protein
LRSFPKNEVDAEVPAPISDWRQRSRRLWVSTVRRLAPAGRYTIPTGFVHLLWVKRKKSIARVEQGYLLFWIELLDVGCEFCNSGSGVVRSPWLLLC